MGERSGEGREKSAECITLMKYHDSLTVRLSSSFPNVPRRRGVILAAKVLL